VPRIAPNLARPYVLMAGRAARIGHRLRKSHTMIRTLAFGAALATLATAAVAQPRYDRRPVEYAPAYGGYAEGAPAGYGRGGAVCQSWCPEDYSPCDPVQFKVADARCRPKMFDR
jgi:hypothetical protein